MSARDLDGASDNVAAAPLDRFMFAVASRTPASLDPPSRCAISLIAIWLGVESRGFDLAVSAPVSLGARTCV